LLHGRSLEDLVSSRSETPSGSFDKQAFRSACLLFDS
jgi:hypothetical protein